MTRFNVPDMSCGHCTAAIAKEIEARDTTAAVTCDLETRSVAVESQLPADALLAAIQEAGYAATLT